MLRKSTALTGTVTALISLLNIDINKPITLGVSPAELAGDTFDVFATLDSAAVDTVNAFQIGTISGTTPPDVLRGYGEQAKGWSYVFLNRTAGATAGTFYVTGEEAQATATVQSTAAAAVDSFTAVLDLTSYSSQGVRIGGSRAMLVGDQFDVYVSQDSTVTNATGCQKLGRIRGGGGVNLNSLVAVGWPYAIVKTIARSSAGGNILAAGAAKIPAGSTGFWQQGGNAFGATGVLGTTDAFGMSIISGGTAFISDNLTITTIGRTAGASGVTIEAGTGNINIGTSASARTVNIATGAATQQLTLGSTSGTSFVTINAGTGAISIGTTAQARTINIGTGGAAQTVTLGSTTGASSATIQAGTGGLTLQTDTTGNIDIDTGSTGHIFIGTGGGGAKNIQIGNAVTTTAVGIHCGTGGMQLGIDNVSHPTSVGSTFGTSSLSLDAGTGNIDIGTSASARAINIGTGAAAQAISIGSTSGTSGIFLSTGSGGVGINATPASSVLLQLDSTTRGFAPPRMTEVQRDAIAAGVIPILIYNTTTNKLNFRPVGGTWEVITSA